MFTHKSRNKL